MINIGWYFYRNYLNQELIQEIDKQKREIEDKKKLNEEIQRIFEKQNAPILNVTWDEQERVASLGNSQKISLKTTYPGLFSGSGIAHGTGETGEFKLGFAFDHTTGQPYLPGSTVKGTIRSAFPFRLAKLAHHLIKKDEKEAKRMFEKAKVLLNDYLLKSDSLNHLSSKQIFQLEWEIFEGAKITNLKDIWKEELTEINFSNLETEPIGSYEGDIFYDAFIYAPNSINKILGKDFITPHKLKTNRNLDAFVNPIPIQFLKVLPNVTFQFNFDLKAVTLDDIVVTQETKKQLFHQILLDFGIGAKTNVGYGQFQDERIKFTYYKGKIKASAVIEGIYIEPKKNEKNRHLCELYIEENGEKKTIVATGIYNGSIENPTKIKFTITQVGKKNEITLGQIQPC